MIEASDLYKVYGDGESLVSALRGVTLFVAPGEFVSIMGPSGCGKSTLLHLLGALDTPTRGEVAIDGRRLSDLDDRRRTRLRRDEIGFVFQSFNLVPVLTVEENVELPLLVARERRGSCAARVDALLRELGLLERRAVLPARLSGGEQQRVAIARALVRDPAVLLADEPTGSLDQATGRSILEILDRLHQRGQTIVLVTHDATVATRADRVLLMRDGEIIDEVVTGSKTDPALALSRIASFTDDVGARREE